MSKTTAVPKLTDAMHAESTTQAELTSIKKAFTTYQLRWLEILSGGNAPIYPDTPPHRAVVDASPDWAKPLYEDDEVALFAVPNHIYEQNQPVDNNLMVRIEGVVARLIESDVISRDVVIGDSWSIVLITAPVVFARVQ